LLIFAYYHDVTCRIDQKIFGMFREEGDRVGGGGREKFSTLYISFKIKINGLIR
jgi:hypothetical protein